MNCEGQDGDGDGASFPLIWWASATPTGLGVSPEGLVRAVLSTHSSKSSDRATWTWVLAPCSGVSTKNSGSSWKTLVTKGFMYRPKLVFTRPVDGVDADVEMPLSRSLVQLEGEHQVPQLRVAVSLPRVVPSPRVVHVAQIELAKGVCCGAGRASQRLGREKGEGRRLT